ncbi:MAG: hypothetical protein JF564_04940 [Sphingomonas sp.]|nr:hypothetical protein [Sphingomonas sp.]
MSDLLSGSEACARLVSVVSAETSGGYSTNPLLLKKPYPGAMVVDASLRSSFALTTDAGSSIEIGGVLTRREYSRVYPGLTTGDIHFVGLYRDDERLSIRSAARIERSLLADVVTSSIDALAGSQGRRLNYLAEAGLIWQPDAYTRIEPQFSYEGNRYSRTDLLANTSAAGARVNISRRVTPYATIGARVGTVRNAIDGQSNFWTTSFSLNADQRLAKAWRATLELGVERAGAQMSFGDPARAPVRARTILAGSVRLCHETSMLTACTAAGLQSEPSGLVGLERRLTISATASRQLRPDVTISMAGDYLRSSVKGTALPTLHAVTGSFLVEWRPVKALTAGARVEYRRRELLQGGAAGAGLIGLRLRYDWRRG